jgi:hypothetical protein
MESQVCFVLCAAGEYCCAGPGRCRIPVPRPPAFEQLPAVRCRSARQSDIVKPAANPIFIDINNQVPSPEGVTPSNVCPDPTMTRHAVPFGSARADGQAKMLMTRTYTWPPAGGCNRPDGTPSPSPCGAPGACTFTSSCSGNTISSGLVLFAAHCIAPADANAGFLEALRAPAIGYPQNADPCNIAALPYTLNSVWVRAALQPSRWCQPTACRCLNDECRGRTSATCLMRHKAQCKFLRCTAVGEHSA